MSDFSEECEEPKIKLPKLAKIIYIDGKPLITIDAALWMNNDTTQDGINSSWVSYVKQILPALQNELKRLEPNIPDEYRQEWWNGN